jgi:hypothetical protein
MMVTPHAVGMGVVTATDCASPQPPVWRQLLAPLRNLKSLRVLGNTQLLVPAMLAPLSHLTSLRVLDMRLNIAPADLVRQTFRTF